MVNQNHNQNYRKGSSNNNNNNNNGNDEIEMKGMESGVVGGQSDSESQQQVQATPELLFKIDTTHCKSVEMNRANHVLHHNLK